MRKTTQRLASMYRAHFKADLQRSLRLFAKNTSIDVRRIIRIVSSLDTTKKWSPQVFFAGYQFGDAIKRLDVTDCYDALAAFDNMSASSMYSKSATVSSVLSEGWEAPFVRHMRAFYVDEKEPPTEVHPIFLDELNTHRRPINEALRLIRKYDPGVGEEFQSYVTRIKLFNGVSLRGETANVVFGSIWLRLPEPDEHPVAYWIEHLVHEIAHLQLYVLSLRDPLVHNSPDERYPAPLRQDLRPMFGNYHATFVLARMVRTFRKITLREKEPAFRESLKTLTKQFHVGLAGISSPNAKLSDVAVRIRSTMHACALET